MYRGTTPIVVFTINSTVLDLAKMKQIWVTFKSVLYEKTYELDDLTINFEDKTVTVQMTQEDTLAFRSGTIKTQIRFLDNNDIAYASNIKEVQLNDVLKEGVISE